MYAPKQPYLSHGTLLYSTAAIQSAVCLTCGLVIPYLDGTELEKVRQWKQADQPNAGEQR
jgi:hypothetical protein